MGRQRCSGCERPASVCLCEELPSPPLQTSRTSVVVLQHPHEARHKLSTLPILSKCLANCHILRGRRFQAGCSSLLDFCASWPYSHALLLFPTPSAQPIATWYRQVTSSPHPVVSPSQGVNPSCSLQDGPCSPPARIPLSSGNIKQTGASDFVAGNSIQMCLADLSQSSTTQDVLDLNSCQHAGEAHDANSFAGFPQFVLIAVDATWQHAKEMIKASAPYLGKFVIPVCLPFYPDEEGSCMANSELIIRKEPFKGCMTTLEAIACCLRVLEPNAVEVYDRLLRVLRRTVQFQASNIVSHKTRTKKQRKLIATILLGDMPSQ